MIFWIYKTATGEINRTLYCDSQATADLNLLSGESNLQNVSEAEYSHSGYYISGGAITPRPLLTTVASWNKTTITGDGSDSCTLSTLPNPTTIKITPPAGVNTIDDQIITDGSFTMTSTFLGSYTVKAVSFPYQDYIVSVTVE